MRMRRFSALISVVLAGCLVPADVSVGSEHSPYWDGHVYVVAPAVHVHCVGCGHYYYDGGWNLYPQDHVYVEAGYVRHSDYHEKSDDHDHGHDHHR
jgi:hypothetical protein